MSSEKVTSDQHSHPHYSLPVSDGSISLETIYVIPVTDISSIPTDHDSNSVKKVRFLVQTPEINGKAIRLNSKLTEMTQRKNLSFVDAVNGKHLDLSTGLFSSSSSLPFVLSSSSSSAPSSSSSPFSSSTSPLDQHRHPHNHFSSSSSSPPHTTTTTIDNKNRLSTSPLSVNNHPPPVGADSTITTTNTNAATTTITLKEAIDANILDARSAYVVDTLEQR